MDLFPFSRLLVLISRCQLILSGEERRLGVLHSHRLGGEGWLFARRLTAITLQELHPRAVGAKDVELLQALCLPDGLAVDENVLGVGKKAVDVVHVTFHVHGASPSRSGAKVAGDAVLAFASILAGRDVADIDDVHSKHFAADVIHRLRDEFNAIRVDPRNWEMTDEDLATALLWDNEFFHEVFAWEENASHFPPESSVDGLGKSQGNLGVAPFVRRVHVGGVANDEVLGLVGVGEGG